MKFRKRSQKAGLPPGSLVYTGEKVDEKPQIAIIEYDDQNFTEREAQGFNECLVMPNKPGVTWINICGISHIPDLEKLGECFNLHPLVLEDILNIDQRPKVEDYDDYLFIVLKSISYSPKTNDLAIPQVSFILGENYVISLVEGDGNVFGAIRERLLTAKGRIRRGGADYLVYALIDYLVDHYFVVLEDFGENLEYLEEEVVTSPTPKTLQDIHRFKNEMIALRKSMWPLREVVARLERREMPFIEDSTSVYFKDVYDHVVVAIDNVETYRDILSGMMDIYLSSISNRLNQIMKVLTIIATIFMPLTFIAGVYGMNFKHLPEIEWEHGYYYALGLMLTVVVSMLTYFKIKKWI
jgi:magnesium transporter